MTSKEVKHAIGLPVSTWVAIVVLMLTMVGAGGTFYANDAVQSDRISTLMDSDKAQTDINRQILGTLQTVKTDVAWIKVTLKSYGEE